ncbi:MAG: hypothetical protein AAGG75_11870 [Bacteroidota bacterium]
MGFLDRLFGGNKEPVVQPDICFGRYSDSYKTTKQYDAWDRALEKFENEDYLGAYEDFFTYLRDEQEDNVRFERKNGTIEFEIFQGSKKITGMADERKIKVEASVAIAEVLNLGFMRRLIEQNFELKYSRFALGPLNNIVIKFDSFTLDGSPYKLYYALKEVATNADKHDDLLVDEFVMLQSVNTTHLKELPLHEKEVKYNFIVKETRSIFKAMDDGRLGIGQYPGGLAYLLLHLSYKLDFLTKPEGVMMETLERVHRMYFANDGQSTARKIAVLRKDLEKLIDRDKSEFFKEMYEVKSTFGITNPANHDRVIAFIDGELHNMDWYNENGYERIALAVPGYIVGYCMFNYAVPAPDRAFFFLFYQITENQYFKDLGFKGDFYNAERKSLNSKSIKRAIRQVAEQNRAQYPRLNPDVGRLRFDTLANFAKSYMEMIRELDMTKVE